MKKTYTLIIIMILAILLNTKVMATDTANISLNVPNTAKRGENITIIISSNGTNEGIKGLQGTLKYDSDKLEYVSNEIKASGWFVSGYNNTTGVFLAEVSDVSDTSSYITKNSPIISFTFKVKNSASIGSSTISLSDIVVSGASSLENTSINKSIKIVENSSNTEGSTDQDTKETTGTNSDLSKNVDNTIANTKMPYTGKNSIIMIGIIVVIISGSLSYMEYRKYKEIK